MSGPRRHEKCCCICCCYNPTTATFLFGVFFCVCSIGLLLTLNVINLALYSVPTLAFINMRRNDTKRNREIFFYAITFFLVVVLVGFSIVAFSQLTTEKAEDLCEEYKEEGSLKFHNYSSVDDCKRRINTNLYFTSILAIPLLGFLFWHFCTVAHTYYQDHGKTGRDHEINLDPTETIVEHFWNAFVTKFFEALGRR